jgi:hypothetical protein
VIRDRDEYPLRRFIWQVVNDLNPHVQRDKAVELRHTYSKDPQKFLAEARAEQRKATLLLQYLGEAQIVLEKAAIHREQEPEPRWQANYDLMMAQVVAYQARAYEYGSFLEAFIQNPPPFALNKAPNLTLNHFHIRTKTQVTSKDSLPYIEKSNELFKIVQQNHPGTPWAARAEWEMKRGFGIDITPVYYGPPTTTQVTTPVPKL